MSESRRLLTHEQGLALGTGDYLDHLRAIGSPSPLTCPDCHGGLWRVRDAVPVRYRCHTGHAFTMRALDVAVAEETDGALWNALRALHERAAVLEQMAETSRVVGAHDEAGRQEATARRVMCQSRLLRALLERSPDAGE